MTSAQKASWDSLNEHLSARQQKVYDTIAASKTGMTIHELCEALKLFPNEVSGRVTELAYRGKILITGKRVNPRSGKVQTVYAIL